MSVKYTGIGVGLPSDLGTFRFTLRQEFLKHYITNENDQLSEKGGLNRYLQYNHCSSPREVVNSLVLLEAKNKFAR